MLPSPVGPKLRVLFCASLLFGLTGCAGIDPAVLTREAGSDVS